MLDSTVMLESEGCRSNLLQSCHATLHCHALILEPSKYYIDKTLSTETNILFCIVFTIQTIEFIQNEKRERNTV